MKVEHTLVHLGTLWIPFRYPRAVELKTVYLSFGTISCSLGKSKARSCIESGSPHRLAWRCTHQCLALNTTRAHGLNDSVHLLEASAGVRLARHGQLPWRFPVYGQFDDAPRNARPTIRDRRTRPTSGGTRQTWEYIQKRMPHHAVCPFQPPTEFLAELTVFDDDDDDDTMAVETQTMPALNGHVFDDDVDMANEPSLRFASGLILPPPEIKCESFHCSRGWPALVLTLFFQP